METMTTTTKTPRFDVLAAQPTEVRGVVGINTVKCRVTIPYARGERVNHRLVLIEAHLLAAAVLSSTPAGERWGVHIEADRTDTSADVVLELMHGDKTEVARAKLVLKSAIQDREITLGVLRERPDGSYVRVAVPDGC